MKYLAGHFVYNNDRYPRYLCANDNWPKPQKRKQSRFGKFLDLISEAFFVLFERER